MATHIDSHNHTTGFTSVGVRHKGRQRGLLLPLPLGIKANREECRLQGYQPCPIQNHKINNFPSLICILIARRKIPPHRHCAVFLYLCDNLCDVSCIASHLPPLAEGVIATSLAQLMWPFFLLSHGQEGIKSISKPNSTLLRIPFRY